MEELKQQYQAARQEKAHGTAPVQYIDTAMQEVIETIRNYRTNKPKKASRWDRINNLTQTELYYKNELIFGGSILAHILGTTRQTINVWVEKGIIERHYSDMFAFFKFRDVVDSMIKNKKQIRLRQ